MTNFSDLGLAEPVLRAVAGEGYSIPTPIQAQTIPHIRDGRDVLGIAQTGTGKTAAFALPILHRLAQHPVKAPARGCRALVLAPTRELAAQIADSFRTYARFVPTSVTVVVGGVKAGPQIAALRRGVDVLVATPGRLIDHMEGGVARLDATEIVVLDEADHMLDLGFLVPIRRILKALPAKRQTIFFSATMPPRIGALAAEMLNSPAKAAVAPVATTVESVSQHVYFVDAARKRSLLVDLVAQPEFTRTLVFTRTKHGADKVTRHLEGAGVAAAAIHGNKSQVQREKALAAFKAGKTRVLVATDIAARGIDVDGISHVVNFELPNVPEAYVHRIGRTARAGASGVAISFCDGAEREYLRDIEKLTRRSLAVVGGKPRPANEDKPRETAAKAAPRAKPQKPWRAQSKPVQHKGGSGGFKALVRGMGTRTAA